MAWHGEKTTSRAWGEPARWPRIRSSAVLSGFLLAFALITFRLFQVHLNPHHKLTDEERGHIGRVDLREPRGDIYDRNGLLLATERQVPSLWADPRAVSDAQEAAILLSAQLGLDEDLTLKRLSRRDGKGNPSKFVWLKRWLSDTPLDLLRDVEEATGGAVSVRYEPLRYYPQGDTAAHVLGFVNRAGEAAEGLELTFNDYLASVPGKHTARKDVARHLLESLTLEYIPPKGGESLWLTLDTRIQHSLERALDARLVECNASCAMGVVLNPHSGEILALATRPAFDPNYYDDYPPEARRNRALLDDFEPGSAFKIVTAAAAIEHGLVTPETLIDCENGWFRLYGRRTIRDFHKMAVEPFTMCFTESSNIAMVKVGAMLGPERMEQWIWRFGFGERTCADFRFESAGLFRPRAKWSGYSMGSLPMGQEISVTALQLARAFAVIANGGYVTDPYLVERAVDRKGRVTYQHESPPPRRILSPATVATMKELSHLVVAHGTGKLASIPEYQVGGKTGTAQIARPAEEGGGYYLDRYTTVFAGFAPVSRPKLVAVIVVREPMIRLHYGGYVCGPVFKEVVREALAWMHVPPKPVAGENKPEDGAPTAPAENIAAAEEDADTVVERVDFEGRLDHLLTPLAPLELVARNTDGTKGSPALPNLVGLTKRQAQEKLRELGVPWDPRGAGWVVKQSPPPGTPLCDVTLCALEFSNTPYPPIRALRLEKGDDA